MSEFCFRDGSGYPAKALSAGCLLREATTGSSPFNTYSRQLEACGVGVYSLPFWGQMHLDDLGYLRPQKESPQKRIIPERN